MALNVRLHSPWGHYLSLLCACMTSITNDKQLSKWTGNMSRFLVCPDSWYIEGVEGSLNIHYLNVPGSAHFIVPLDFTEILQMEMDISGI